MKMNQKQRPPAMGMLLILLWIFVNAQCVVSTSSTDSEVLASSSLRGNAISGEYSQNERQLWGWDFQNLMYHLGGCPDPDPSSCCSSNSQKKGPLHCGCPNCDLPNASFQFCQQKEEICGSSSSSAYFVASQSWDSSSAEDGGQVAAVPTCHDGSSVQCVSSSYGAGTCYCADENVEFGVQCEDDSCSDELNARSGGSQGSTRTINWLPYIFGGVMLAGMFAFAMKKRDSKREIKGSVGKKALSDLGTEGDGSTVGDDASSGAFEVGLHGQVAYANADTLEAVDPVTPTNAAKRPRGFLSMFGFGLCRGQNRAEI